MLDIMKVIGYNKVCSAIRQSNKAGVRKLLRKKYDTTFNLQRGD